MWALHSNSWKRTLFAKKSLFFYTDLPVVCRILLIVTFSLCALSSSTRNVQGKESLESNSSCIEGGTVAKKIDETKEPSILFLSSLNCLGARERPFLVSPRLSEELRGLLGSDQDISLLMLSLRL
jgi:hypothetical protein